jgi:hypothetical protein
MKALLRLLLGLTVALTAALAPLAAHAQARVFNQAELDALLAPIALYPDPLLNQVLDASLYPDEVAEAAAWSRANPQLNGDAAVQTVEGAPWHPSVKALLASPEVLARMGESPQWVADLGQAFAMHGPYIQTTVQQLRARAQASGYLQSDQYQQVYTQDSQIVVQPAYPNVVYVPYYNPFVVYGTWWWPAYRPVYWRPWVPHPVYVSRAWYPARVWHPTPVRAPVRAAPVGRFDRRVVVTPYRPVPESQRRPIISSPPALSHPVVVQRPMDQARFRGAPEIRPQARMQAPMQHSAPPMQHSAPPMQRSAPPMQHSAPMQQRSAPVGRFDASRGQQRR